MDGQEDGGSVGVQRELRVQMWHTSKQGCMGNVFIT